MRLTESRTFCKVFAHILLCVALVTGSASCRTPKEDASTVRIAGGEVVATSSDSVAKLVAKNAVTLQVPGGNCTGSLISPKIIITAAHCVTRQGGPFRVFFPSAQTPAESSQIVDPAKVIVNADFVTNNSRANQPMHDLAMFILHDPAPLPYEPVAVAKSGTPIKTIELTPSSIASRGQKAFIVGSGQTTRNAPSDHSLRFAEVEAYVSLPAEKSIVFSAPNASGCPGDSGGPVYIKEGNTLVLVGVIALGNCDTTEDFVTLATDLRAYVTDWIPNHAAGQATKVADVSYEPSALVRPENKVRDVVSAFASPPSVPAGVGQSETSNPIKCSDSSNTERVSIDGDPVRIVIRGGNFSGNYQNVSVTTNSAYATYQLNDRLEFRINLTSKQGVLIYRSSAGPLRDFTSICQF